LIFDSVLIGLLFAIGLSSIQTLNTAPQGIQWKYFASDMHGLQLY